MCQTWPLLWQAPEPLRQIPYLASIPAYSGFWSGCRDSTIDSSGRSRWLAASRAGLSSAGAGRLP